MTGTEVILDRIATEYSGIDAETVATFREVFDTPAGREVLAWLLSVLGFFSSTDSSAEEALMASVGKLILAKLGIWHPSRMLSLTNALMELPGVVPEHTRPHVGRKE